MGGGKPVSELNLHQPVYVSMTTTSERIRYVAYSLMDVFKGSIIPTHVSSLPSPLSPLKLSKTLYRINTLHIYILPLTLAYPSYPGLSVCFE